MSRAFVKDDDEAFVELPDRPISPAPNWVTASGLEAIEAELARLHHELLGVGDNRYERARVGRDLRYWTARKASAQIAPIPASCETAQFGLTVDIERDDGRRSGFQIVGEDEAEPSKGTISHASPLARALIGKRVGDVVRVNNADIEIIAIR